jgi:hypothetical protein
MRPWLRTHMTYPPRVVGAGWRAADPWRPKNDRPHGQKGGRS